MARTYRELIAWQKGMDLVDAIYVVIDLLPASETFGMISMLRRSGISIPSLIAEGHGRGSDKEFSYLLLRARGLLQEVETIIESAFRKKMIAAEPYNDIFARTSEMGRILNGLISSLKKNLATESQRDEISNSYQSLVIGHQPNRF